MGFSPDKNTPPPPSQLLPPDYESLNVTGSGEPSISNTMVPPVMVSFPVVLKPTPSMSSVPRTTVKSPARSGLVESVGSN